ncbi:uncharacterized protein LOC123011405 [Tribolium madens]|uniref:uncharacterized protein LOC123011405 n=1 Tax=Tribolium madens TaxID=41895 RepID=UPI001CF7509B|nr:uncharacterized protein LOC123011405 [Tribolium madens]
MTILCVFFSVLIIQGAFGSSIEDAEKALQELNDFSLEIQRDLRATTDKQSAILHDNVHELEVSATQEIRNQIASVSDKIKTLTANVESIVDNIDYCQNVTEKNLETFGEELEKKLKECSDHLIMAGNGMLHSTWSKILYDYDFHYNCNKESLWQCNYENATCADSVIGFIEFAKSNMQNTSKIITVEMLNRVTGMSFPCRDMAVQEIENYSALILNYVSSCLKNLGDVVFEPRC